MTIVKLTRVLNPHRDAPRLDETGAPILTDAVRITPESVRCFYARKNGETGTRITFSDGGGFAVAESADEVAAILAGAIRLARVSLVMHDPYDCEEGEPDPTLPAAINADSVRCFYRRKYDKPGTRITFRDGGGFAVAESEEMVETLLNRATRTLALAPPAAPQA